jgi:hypothetical protein
VARDSPPVPITVLDAILATLAFPGTFESVTTDDHELVSGDLGVGNPSREVIDAAFHAFGGEELVSAIVNLGSGHMGVKVAGSESATTEQAEMLRLERIALDCEQVANELAAHMSRLGIFFRLSVDQGMQIQDVQSYSRKWQAHRSVMAHTTSYLQRFSQLVEDCVEALKKGQGRITFRDLRKSNITRCAFCLYCTTGSPGRISIVADSLPQPIDRFVMRKEPWEFMERVMLKRNEDERDRQRMLIISGMAGTGKTQLTLWFVRAIREK